MLFDLGLNHKHLDNQTLVMEKIEEIETDFDFSLDDILIIYFQ